MLALEQPLIDELGKLPELVKVYGMADFDDLEKAGKPTPCAFVIYDGYRVIESNRQRRAARVETRWLVVLAVKSAASTIAGGQARLAAAPLATTVLRTLLDWVPPPGYTPLSLETPPPPVFQAGALLFPLAFATQHVV
ncbi:MAG TPA: hypothetical protein PK752_00730 [Accumulibacter sp.]|uniref:phage tail terminator protein n=1 Tax=Accumulibacter sp. TaxID=2053492 RepID=UPI002CAD5B9D|nr:hypothetical protein [Accumulibacter sp.]HRD86771.1 hypothetical protein [Accumulibacter sp.]